MAVPGDVACREVAACGSARWGNAPDEVSTQYVDAAYTGVDSIGTKDKPWSTIQQGIDAAAFGAVVAVAAGSYPENVVVSDSPVQLWGRCPAQVEIVGSAAEVGTVLLLQGAHGSSIRSLAVRGATNGIVSSGSQDIVADQVWIHDVAGQAFNGQNDLGATHVTLRGSLVERGRGYSVYTAGATLDVEASVVRDTILVDDGIGVFGAGVGALPAAAPGGHSALRVVGSVIERNPTAGVAVIGSDAVIEASVVRAIVPPQGARASGIAVQSAPGAGRASATIRASVVEQSIGGGIYIAGSDAVIESAAIRDIGSDETGGGRGIGIEDEPASGERADVSVRGSLVARTTEVGVFVAGSTATMESTIVRDTHASPESSSGRGVGVQGNPMTGERATATIRGCVIARSTEAGIFVAGQEVSIEDTLVSDTQPTGELLSGRGIELRDDVDTGRPTTGAIIRSRVERSREMGIFILSSRVTVEATTVLNTLASAQRGAFGDGIAVVSGVLAAELTARDSRVEGSARAGVSNFGSVVALSGSVLECNAFPLDGESYLDQSYSFDDQGGNACGCGPETFACVASSAGLTPAQPLPPTP
jgi:hypothetical protein